MILECWKRQRYISQIAPLGLFSFDCLEKCFEVTCAKALMVSPLDRFDEQSWSVFDWLAEYLEEIALLVKIDQYTQLLNGIEVLSNLGTGGLTSLP